MRLMSRNKRAIWYRLFLGTEKVVDEDGYETGESHVIYGTPTRMMAVVSSEFGRDQIEMFGDFQRYDKVVTTDDIKCPVTENSVLYVDKGPGELGAGDDYDYIVKRVSKSLNSISYAISKVDVS